MYSPILSEKVVMTLYRLKRSRNQPITRIAEELIVKSFNAVEKDLVCRVCIGERNNDCESCYLAGEKKITDMVTKIQFFTEQYYAGKEGAALVFCS